MAANAQEIDKAVKKYIGVFVGLMILTAVTVGIAQIPNVSTPMAVTMALIVASIKGTLVAGYFMHLFDEKKIVYFTLAMTMLFFLVLIFFPIWTSTGHGG